MTITLDLKPEEAAILSDYARGQNTDVQTVLHKLVAQLPPQPADFPRPEKQNAAAALLQGWLSEKGTLTPEELQQNDQEFEDFKTNMNRWRTEEGRSPAFR